MYMLYRCIMYTCICIHVYVVFVYMYMYMYMGVCCGCVVCTGTWCSSVRHECIMSKIECND